MAASVICGQVSESSCSTIPEVPNSWMVCFSIFSRNSAGASFSAKIQLTNSSLSGPWGT
ncbi:hypothetical protein D3C72_2530820 [compost metagenome]